MPCRPRPILPLPMLTTRALRIKTSGIRARGWIGARNWHAMSDTDRGEGLGDEGMYREGKPYSTKIHFDAQSASQRQRLLRCR